MSTKGMGAAPTITCGQDVATHHLNRLGEMHDGVQRQWVGQHG